MSIAPAVSAQADCGCTGARSTFVEAREDADVEAVVLARVAIAEGSARRAAGSSAEREHPYPWLRYLLVVERSWKGELASFWVERPWGRCGSVLWPGRAYLVAVPAGRDPDATMLRGASAATLTACQRIAPVEQAADQIAALGEPRARHQLRVALERELPIHVRALVQTRVHCLTSGDAAPALTEMTPGEWAQLAVRTGGLDETWQVGQNGTAADGRDQVLVAAHNSGPCWLRVQPEVRARWAVEGSARRVLDSHAGLTFHEGWVPPYWRGVLSLGRDLPWIRQARWSVEAFATPRTGPPRTASEEDLASTSTLRLSGLEPEPGAYVGARSLVSGRLSWTGEIASAPLWVKPVLEAEGDRLVDVAYQGKRVEWPVTSDRRTVDFEIPLVEALELGGLTDPLKLRFVVEARSDEHQVEVVDATPPVTYLHGEEPPRKTVPPPSSGTWYSGGSGDGCEDAIVIHGARSVEQGIAAERAWWRKRYPGSKMLRQGVGPPVEAGAPVYEHITIAPRGGGEVTLCFDIKEFWGAPLRVCPPPADCDGAP